MNRLWLILSLIPGLSSGQAPAPPQAPAPAGLVEVNRIAATVNGLPITLKELRVMLAPIFNQLMAEYPRGGPELQRILLEEQEKILQELIDREIIMSEFEKLKKKGANLPDQVVDQEIERQIRDQYNGDSQRFREELAKGRMTMASYRTLTREKLIVQAMRQEKFQDAPPAVPSEIRAEYQASKDALRDTTKDSITYRKIFLPLLDPANPLATPETQLALAEAITKDVRAGADFTELAQKHSQDAFAAEGGLQTDVPRPDLSPEFAAILFEGKDGEILGPLENPAGFTVAKIEKINKGPAPPFDEVKELMEQRIRAKRTSERYEEWMEGLREKALIKKMIK